MAIRRSFMSNAKMMVIDEPSVGLAPMVRDDFFKRIK